MKSALARKECYLERLKTDFRVLSEIKSATEALEHCKALYYSGFNAKALLLRSLYFRDPDKLFMSLAEFFRELGKLYHFIEGAADIPAEHWRRPHEEPHEESFCTNSFPIIIKTAKDVRTALKKRLWRNMFIDPKESLKLPQHPLDAYWQEECEKATREKHFPHAWKLFLQARDGVRKDVLTPHERSQYIRRHALNKVEPLGLHASKEMVDTLIPILYNALIRERQMDPLSPIVLTSGAIFQKGHEQVEYNHEEWSDAMLYARGVTLPNGKPGTQVNPTGMQMLAIARHFRLKHLSQNKIRKIERRVTQLRLVVS